MERIKVENLSLWEAFYWVARTQSFTAAARKMQLSVPFLSKKVRQLEEALSLRLFVRTTRRVRATQEAEALLPRIEALLAEAGEIERGARPERVPAGLLRITALPAFAQRCLAPALVEFQQRYPLVHFDLHVSDALVDIVEAQVDVAIRVQEPTGAQFVFRKLVENRLVFCAAPSYLEKAKAPLKRVADIRKHPLLMLPVHDRCRIAGSAQTLATLRGPQSVHCESGLLLTELAIHGAGVAVRSLWDVAPLFQTGELTRILPSVPLDPFGTVYAVTPHRRLLLPRVRAFLDFLTEKGSSYFQY